MGDINLNVYAKPYDPPRGFVETIPLGAHKRCQHILDAAAVGECDAPIFIWEDLEDVLRHATNNAASPPKADPDSEDGITELHVPRVDLQLTLDILRAVRSPYLAR